MLKFPFWVVMPGEVESPPSHAECGTGDLPVAFTTIEKMTAYLSARSAGNWRMRLVNHTALLLLIADLHQLESEGICLDPEPDGSAGTRIPLSELMKMT